MKIQLPEKVNRIITTLQKHGFEAYAVGGCVRDSFLGRVPGDWDITTSAAPEETKSLFARTFDTGIEHGTITVLLNGEGFEVTTYRIDGKYEDNRCVGNAEARFSEDALRILRAIRFSAQLGFEIEKETRQAIRKLAPNLSYISAERIQTELVKLLVSDHPEKIRDAYELGITKVILPEFDAMMETTQETLHHCYNVGEHTIHALMNIPADKVLRLTMLFHDTGKPARKTVDPDGTAHFKGHAYVSEELTKSIMHRLKFDNDTLRKVSKLVLYHDDRMPATMKHVRRAMNRISAELFPYYMKVRMADTLAQSDYQRDKKLENLAGIEKCYQEILEKKQCVSLKELKVNGQDLIAAGIEKGPKIGQTLQTLLQEVIEEPEKNTREYLLARIKELE